MPKIRFSKNGIDNFVLSSEVKYNLTFNVTPTNAEIIYSVNGGDSQILTGKVLSVKPHSRVEYSVRKDNYYTVSDTINSVEEDMSIDVTLYTHFAQTFTSNTTIEIPSTAKDIQCWLVGGGGSGGSYWYKSTYGMGNGGGGGGYSYNNYGNSLAGTSQTITVGSAGAVVTGAPQNGIAGGTSTFASQTASGGGGGGWEPGSTPRGAGGSGTGGSDNRTGGTGGTGGVGYGGAGGSGWTIANVNFGYGGTGHHTGQTTETGGGCCRIEYDYC